MAINLLENIQQKLGYEPLQKVDPNTQEVKTEDKAFSKYRFSQAAIPSIIIGLYKLSTTDEGATAILNEPQSTNWVDGIFGVFEDEAVKRIADYSNHTIENTHVDMDAIAEEAIVLIRQDVPDNDIKKVKELLADQRTTVLPFLPASIQIGELLNDSTLDDRTNKMEGPMSNLMHKIGNIFSGAESDVKQ